MLDLDYSGPAGGARADLVINTSCEHLPEFDRWYARIPRRARLLVMQSNDYFAVPRARELRAPTSRRSARRRRLRDVQFAGERRMRRYVRFMLIGRK